MTAIWNADSTSPEGSNFLIAVAYHYVQCVLIPQYSVSPISCTRLSDLEMFKRTSLRPFSRGVDGNRKHVFIQI